MIGVMKRILFAFGILLFMISCAPEEIPGQLEFESDIIYVPAEAGSQHVMLNSTTEWRLEFPSSVTWLTTDLHGGKPNRKYFTMSFTDNPYTSVRFCNMKIYTTDKKAAKEFRVIQLPKRFSIGFAKDRLTIRQNAGEYEINFKTSIENASLNVSTDSEDWINLFPLESSDTTLTFYVDHLPEVVPKSRNGYIYMSYTDEYNRFVADTLQVRQLAAYSERAELLSFADAQRLQKVSGEVEENYMVEGFVTAYGAAENYCASIHETNISGYRYILEDEQHNTLLFESDSEIDLERGKKVQLWLLGLSPVKYSEGSFSYYVFSGVQNVNIIPSESTDVFVPRVMSPSELRYTDVFTMVTLKDMEVATLNGAFTNFKESSPSGVTATSDTHTLYWDYEGGKINWMKSFPEYYRFYPTPLVAKDGSLIYMHISPTVSWAHEAYPQNSGTITGIVVRESFTNFDIKESTLGIRPLCREDIALDQERFTQTLVNFEFDNKENYLKDGELAKFLPNIQQTTSETPCTFTREGATIVTAGHGSNVKNLAFQDKFRGDKSGGRATGLVVWTPANTITTFLVEDLCTKGITGAITMTIEANSSKANPSNHVRARVYYSLDGESWTIVDNSEVKFLSQFDRADAGEKGNREETHVTGMKMFAVSLPPEILDKESISLKIEQTDAKGFGKTLRIGSITIKYNK